MLLYFNTTNYNTALGSNVSYDNTLGHDNIGSGLYALCRNTTGNNNVANGSGALFNNLTGNNNTADGNGALTNNQFGSNNTALGYNADVTIDTLRMLLQLVLIRW